MGEVGAGVDPGVDDSEVSPLEASGRVEFFVRVVGADGAIFRGEATALGFEQSIAAIRYYSNVTRDATVGTRCTAFRFTKVADKTSALFARAISNGQPLQNVRLDFVKGDRFIWQTIDLTGMRISKLEQAVAPPEEFASSLILEEVTLVPATTATVKLTSTPPNPDGSGGASIVTTYTCRP